MRINENIEIIMPRVFQIVYLNQNLYRLPGTSKLFEMGKLRGFNSNIEGRKQLFATQS